MAICPSCEGVIGRDCFNPEECMWITQQQASSAEAAQQNVEELRHILQQLKAEILPILVEAVECFQMGETGDGERLVSKATAKLTAI